MTAGTCNSTNSTWEIAFGRNKTSIHSKNHVKLISIFERMKKLCADQSIRLVVVCMHSKAEVYPWLLDTTSQRLSATGASGYSAAIAKICGQLDIPYLNMTLLMADAAVGLYKSTGDMFYWQDDTHFNHI
jgi:hypothetical protein